LFGSSAGGDVFGDDLIDRQGLGSRCGERKREQKHGGSLPRGGPAGDVLRPKRPRISIRCAKKVCFRAMDALMMDFPLTLSHLFDRAGKYFGPTEIVWRRPDKTIARSTFAQFHQRAQKLANA